MFNIITIPVDHPKTLDCPYHNCDLPALFNHYKDKPGFKEYIDDQFDFEKMRELYSTARPKGYRANEIYLTNCALKARLAFFSYVIDVFYPTNKLKPLRNKNLAVCDEIDNLILYTKQFTYEKSNNELITRLSKQIYKHLKDNRDWFNFEGLIAFKLLSAVEASRNNEAWLNLPTFTDQPERVARLKPAHEPRHREDEDTLEPVPRKRRKKVEHEVAPVQSIEETMYFTQNPYELATQDKTVANIELDVRQWGELIISISSSQQPPTNNDILLANLNTTDMTSGIPPSILPSKAAYLTNHSTPQTMQASEFPISRNITPRFFSPYTPQPLPEPNFSYLPAAFPGSVNTPETPDSDPLLDPKIFF